MIWIFLAIRKSQIAIKNLMSEQHKSVFYERSSLKKIIGTDAKLPVKMLRYDILITYIFIAVHLHCRS